MRQGGKVHRCTKAAVQRKALQSVGAPWAGSRTWRWLAEFNGAAGRKSQLQEGGQGSLVDAQRGGGWRIGVVSEEAERQGREGGEAGEHQAQLRRLGGREQHVLQHQPLQPPQLLKPGGVPIHFPRFKVPDVGELLWVRQDPARLIAMEPELLQGLQQADGAWSRLRAHCV